MNEKKRANKPKRFLLRHYLIYACGLMMLPQIGSASTDSLWHNERRVIRYKPEGKSFIGMNGNRKFNRALYGTNTAYRTEAGDKPEFALYMPGMGGNLKLGVMVNGKSKWLSECAQVKAIYTPGAMQYELQDELLGQGVIYLHILSRADADGMVLKLSGKGMKADISLLWIYGGATGRKFSRDGDIGADPESVFYLHPEYCKDNEFAITRTGFELLYGSGKVAPSPDKRRKMKGEFPDGEYKIVDAAYQSDPSAAWSHKAGTSPIFAGKLSLEPQKDYFFTIYNPESLESAAKQSAAHVFSVAESARKQLADRVEVHTPDAYINTLGGALSVAADAIWESPTFLHGAVAWRMRLNAWRGAYAADVLGWHDRAKLHFDSYSNSQVLEPKQGPITPDTSRHFARQLEEMGTAMFSSGYISRNPNANNRPHHYDMNLVFFDQMFNYFNWTGDTAFLQKMWPVLERHMAWEKRNFDQDGDGLYDAYAAIWASDALQYSGGGVTHTSSYNYRANQEMARLAKLLGKDGSSYQKEAEHIIAAMRQKLWLPASGTFAEFKDLLGNQLLHGSPGLWTIYHAIDSKVPNPFQAYQMLKYVDNHIPHIPIKAGGLENKDLYTLSTSNWQPYTWSVNNVALAELLHTSLAYWQGNNKEEAFKLWKSSLMESMYLGASPGSFQQLSFYDAIRGELYRDFADPVGMAARSLVEGLYGIQPDLLSGTLNIQPGLPHHWNFASLKTPDIAYDYKRTGNKDLYTIVPHFGRQLALTLNLSVYHQSLKSVKVNGEAVSWKQNPQAVGYPEISIQAGRARQYLVELEWSDSQLNPVSFPKEVITKKSYQLASAGLQEIYDPQQILESQEIMGEKSVLTFRQEEGHHTFFVKASQGDWTWWQAIDVNIQPEWEWEIKTAGPSTLDAGLISRVDLPKKTSLWLNGKKVERRFKSDMNAYTFRENIILGSNKIELKSKDQVLMDTTLTSWAIASSASKFEPLAIQESFNGRLNKIFEQKYLSPRPQAVTLQLPWQGIGNWCYPWIQPDIDDSGLKEKAKVSGTVIYKNIPFRISPDTSAKDIAFVSKWDNYPDSLTIAASGKAKHAYFLMAGTTNHMQSRMTNGVLRVLYTDGSFEELALKNPQNWWPIEQDLYNDGFAFTTDAPKPPRLLLKSGEFMKDFDDYKSIKGFSSFGIEGGAATLLDLPLNPSKTIKSIRLKAETNDVVIGLMAVTFIPG